MNRYQAVQDVLQLYFDGLYHADPSRLTRAFHPKAIYATADNDPFLFRTMDDYMTAVAQRVSPASRIEPRQDVIDAIEFAGDNTAFARVRCAIANRQFVDFLTLVKTQDTWRILSKVFHIKPTPAPSE